MRTRSRKLPFRVVIAGLSLSGLGVAAALPTIAEYLPQGAESPIITGSVDKVDTDQPAMTDLPPTSDIAPEVVPRQILTSAPESMMAVPSEDLEAVAVSADESDPIVAPMMTDSNSAPELGMTASLAGEATDAGGIVLALDHARILRVVGDVTTIIIGNPAIADAAMPDPGTIVLTGKSYGETNIVMLDEAGDIVAEQTLRVTVRGQSLVSVYRGVQRTTLSCAPTCEIRPTPGDNTEGMTAGLQQFDERNRAALEAVSNQ